MASFVAPTTPAADTAANQAYLHDECVFCFDPLYRKEVSFLVSKKKKRVCSHYFHTDCICDFEKSLAADEEEDEEEFEDEEISEGEAAAEEARPQNGSEQVANDDRNNEEDDEAEDEDDYDEYNMHRCPLCRTIFHHSTPVPPIEVDAKAWFDLMDIDKDGCLSFDEIVVGLKSQLPLDWAQIEAHVDEFWSQWDKDQNGTISYEEFADGETGVLAYLKKTYPKNPRPEPPNLLVGYHEWFDYWDEDGNGALDKAEITRALIKTFRIYNMNKSSIEEIVDKIFPLFDHDGSGVIEREEFIAPDNLGDTIAAEISHMLGEQYEEEDLENYEDFQLEDVEEEAGR